MEVKGWDTDYRRCSLEGLTNNEFTNFISDLQKMVPNEFRKHIDWDQTKTGQGTWPTKTFFNMRFKNETNLATMIGLLKIVKKMSYELHGLMVSARLEMRPKRKPLTEA